MSNDKSNEININRKKRTDLTEIRNKLVEQREKLNETADEAYRDGGSIDSDQVKQEHDKFDALSGALKEKIEEMRNEETRNIELSENNEKNDVEE